MKTIAVFMAGQKGDIMCALSAMRYRDEIFGDAKIVWYAAIENFDLFKYQDIEVREFPRGFGYPQMVYEENKKLVDAGKEPVWEDWLPLVDEKNHLNLALKNNYPSLADIDYGYFPAAHQIPVQKRHGWDYPVCSKKIFGIPDHYEWHPVIKVSEEEKQIISKWFPPYHVIANSNNELVKKKTIAIETFAGSGQSLMNDEMVRNAMKICRQELGECYFIFVSHKYLRSQEDFPEELMNDKDVYFASQYSVRQCAYIVACCDLLISVSSGVTVAASCWENKYRPGSVFKSIIQFCGSIICSTISLSEGRRFELVTYDDKPFENAKNEFYEKLKLLLNERNS